RSAPSPRRLLISKVQSLKGISRCRKGGSREERRSGGPVGGQKTPPFAGAKRRGRKREEGKNLGEGKGGGWPCKLFFENSANASSAPGTCVQCISAEIDPLLSAAPTAQLLQYSRGLCSPYPVRFPRQRNKV